MHYPNTLSSFQVGGEVATPHVPSCTQMGYQGRHGSDSIAAMWDYTYYGVTNVFRASPLLNPWGVDAPMYTIGNLYPSSTNYSRFRYGGVDC